MHRPPTHDRPPLEDLARRARRAAAAERSRWPRHWDALAAGALPGAEVTRLRTEAAACAQAAAAFEVFRPLSAGFRARIMAQVRVLLRPLERQRRRGRRRLAVDRSCGECVALGFDWIKFVP